MPDKKPLNAPRAPPVKYERNLIRLAVCELRFPTVLELETRSPVEVQAALRREYPRYTPNTVTTFNPPQEVVREKHHLFSSRDQNWTVTFKASALALECRRYESFEQFAERLDRVLVATKKTIDSDFFTRVGLRYIDELPVGPTKLEGWVNPALVKPLTDGLFGDPEQYQQEVRGVAKSGRYSFRHGIASRRDDGAEVYTLDADFYDENVEFDRVRPLLTTLHDECFALFEWAIGANARAYMGKAHPK